MRLKKQDGSFAIIVEGTKIGEIELYNGKDISYIEIYDSDQGNGYGPKALNLAIKRIKGQIDEHQQIRVSTPVHESLVGVLLNNNFEKKSIYGDEIWVFVKDY